MCGIAGIVGGNAAAWAGKLAGALLRLLEHRGPDDHGWLAYSSRQVYKGRGEPCSLGAEVVLLHRRLSILDRSEGGWQPMGTPDGRHFIIFNGEIYNYLELRDELETLGHVFHSHSDTEVLLHAYVEWGRAALNKLVGMFAFAVLDTLERRLFLARDFFGIKPLYYIASPGRFAFASEIKPLLELPDVTRAANPQRLFEYLRFGRTDHGGDTLFAVIAQLPAAHYLEISLDRPHIVQPVRYWDVDVDDRIDISLDEATVRLRELFLDSVRLHLRSDVPVGAALSGGIDSSAIVAAMRVVEPRLDLHTFTYVADEPGLSEERWAKLAGDCAGATSHRIQPCSEELIDDLDRIVYQQEEPFGSTSIYAQHRVFQHAREVGIPVMLDGQGADELLGGYRSYLAARFASLLRRGRWLEASKFLKRSAKLPGSGGAKRLLLQSGGFLLPGYCKTLGHRLLGEDLMPDWLNAGWFRDRGVRPVSQGRIGSRNVLRSQLYQTLAETSLPMLLRYEDRNSMAHSIESRVPFLTPGLVSFVLRLPEHYLIAPDGTSKSVFRRAMRGIVPDAVLDRKDKVGFATPEQDWLSGMSSWVERVLGSETAKRIPALDEAEMLEEWRAIRLGRRPFDFRVWRWVNLIRWAERFEVEFDHV
jgi:asparagine synthase (glutamine-hydrolysing)